VYSAEKFESFGARLQLRQKEAMLCLPGLAFALGIRVFSMTYQVPSFFTFLCLLLAISLF
jgi:hypothetical protein